MINKTNLEALFQEHGFSDFKWMNAKDIVVAEWVRFRCMFGCPGYGKCGTCPPNLPSVDECRKMISEYSQVAVFHFQKQVAKPEDRKPWCKEIVLQLLQLERAVLLEGYYKTFLLSIDNCELCSECSPNRADCTNPKMARPGPDALGIDVFATVRGIGYPIEVLRDFDQEMNRYAFLLVE